MRKINRRISWAGVERLVNKIAREVLTEREKITSVYGVYRGGLIPAAMLSHKLNIPVVNQITKSTLVIDDVVDSGVSLSGLVSKHGNKYCASLFIDMETTCFYPSFVGEQVANEWIIFPWETQLSSKR